MVLADNFYGKAPKNFTFLWMEDKDNILNIVQNIYNDIRAEVVIADLVENGFSADDIIASSKGIFKRRYARDIESTISTELHNGKNLLEVTLNRDSIYDSLPEGLFHEAGNKSDANPKNTSQGSKRAKQEEKAARDFFLPFENEIFRQNVQIELEERQLLTHFSEKLFDDIYPEIWHIHKQLPRKYIHRLALLLHFAHKIAGHKGLMAKCLETILEEKVEIEIKSNLSISKETIDTTENESNCLLGESKLGVDFVCGDNFADNGKTLEFKIGPLKNTKVPDYLADGPLNKFLNCFYGYFVPIDFDVKSNVYIDKTEQGFELNEAHSGLVLGYETAI